MQKPNITQKTADVIVMTGLTQQGDYAKFYFESNPRYSPGGGTITMSFPARNLIGEYFFSHVAPDTLQKFIAGCDEGYLIDKLFPKLEEYVDLESGTEFFEWVRREGLDELKEARHSGLVTKQELRSLYDTLKDREFSGMSHLCDLLYRGDINTLNKIYGDDWYFDRGIEKANFDYQWLYRVMGAALEQLKQLIEVPA